MVRCRSKVILSVLLALLMQGIGRADAPVDSFEEHYERAKQLFQRGRYDECVEELKGAYAIQPNPELLLNLGHALRKLGRHEEALRDYRRYQERATDPGAKRKAERHILEVQDELRRQAERDAKSIAQREEDRRTQLERDRQLKELLEKERLRDRPRPLVQRWWLWTAVGGVVALGIAGAVVASRPWDQVPGDIPRDDLTFPAR